MAAPIASRSPGSTRLDPPRPRAGPDAHDSLRKVLGYVHADIVEAACARIPLTRNAVGSDGTITDPAVREQIKDALRALSRYAVDRKPE